MHFYSVRTKQPLSLGAEIARGGEGIIYDILGDSTKVAKVYVKPLEYRKTQKLEAMSLAAVDQLTQVAAWPTELLVRQAQDNSSKAVGFLMPKAASPEQLHELYTPKSRARSFPEADLRFILHVAANIVRAFGTVHQAGHVIGDVNHAHLLVNEKGYVRLIDCDSFQINTGGQTYTCDVGSPLFTPPELQGQTFRGLARTANHDRFGLAVLLFHLLYLGRHPFAGIPADPRQSSEIESAIKAGRFAYGANRQKMGISQPPGTIPLDTYGQHIATLFETAFANPSMSRPDELAWLSAIRILQQGLKACSAASSHQYPNHLTQCPWCIIEQKTAVRLFGTKFRNDFGRNTINVAQLWAAIEMVPRPQKIDDPDHTNVILPEQTEAELKKQQMMVLQKIVAIFSIIAVLCAGAIGERFIIAVIIAVIFAKIMWPKTSPEEMNAAKVDATNAQQEYSKYLVEWHRVATEKRFIEIYDKLKIQNEKLRNLPQERMQRVKILTSESKQREEFLDRFRISNSQIPNIGSGRKATLASFGIETAWDISKSSILAIPGFGHSLAQNLLDWRKQHEMKFRFNPNYQPSPSDIRSLDADIMVQQANITLALQRGPQELRRASEESNQARLRLQPLLSQKYLVLQLAKRRLIDLGG